ncbi:MAG: SAM-dependent methyltransferase [Candidatus Methylomirabilota bacterium]|nr:class I SAM-dependent methyltransferase [Candidatus Methylomirabilis sp.]PWB47272.1 MAG: SAM-dependent methyltransferase [candidate division NC10 bacterium]
MSEHKEVLPGHGLHVEKMPGHWLLAQMGKRVLRPGGLELTRRMLDALNIRSTDRVVEFAPGLGVTAQIVLAKSPSSYTAVEADEVAATRVRGYLSGDNQRCVVGQAEESGLPDACATVVYCEAMLSMKTPEHKATIIQEAKRLLVPGGRCGIHELALVPDDIETAIRDAINRALSQSIHVGVRPMTGSEWRALLEHEGLSITAQATAPMHLLEPSEMIRNEGVAGMARIAWNVLRNPAARQRIHAMRRVFRQYDRNLAALMLVAEKENS